MKSSLKTLRKLAVIVVLVTPMLTFAQSKKAVKLYEKGDAAFAQDLLIDASVQYTEAIAAYPDYYAAYDKRAQCFARIGQK